MKLIVEFLLSLVVGAIALLWVIAEMTEDWWRGKK